MVSFTIFKMSSKPKEITDDDIYRMLKGKNMQVFKETG